MVASLHECRVAYAYIRCIYIYIYITWHGCLYPMVACPQKGHPCDENGIPKKSSKKEVPTDGSIQHFPRHDPKRRVLKRGSSLRVHQVVCCHQAQLELFVERGWGAKWGNMIMLIAGTATTLFGGGGGEVSTSQVPMSDLTCNVLYCEHMRH